MPKAAKKKKNSKKIKKQKQSEMSAKQMKDISQTHKMQEVSPPQDPEISVFEKGSYKSTQSERLQTWFKAARDFQKSGTEYQGVESVVLSPDHATGNEMLYEGKKGHKNYNKSAKKNKK